MTYIFPTENGLRCDTRRWTGGWHISGHFHFSVQPWSTRQLMETDHWHKMQEDGVWITLDGLHMGWGDDSGPQRAAAVAPEPNALAVRGLIVAFRGATAPHLNRITRIMVMKFSELAPRERHNFVYFLLFFSFTISLCRPTSRFSGVAGGR